MKNLKILKFSKRQEEFSVYFNKKSFTKQYKKYIYSPYTSELKKKQNPSGSNSRLYNPQKYENPHHLAIRTILAHFINRSFIYARRLYTPAFFSLSPSLTPLSLSRISSRALPFVSLSFSRSITGLRIRGNSPRPI